MVFANGKASEYLKIVVDGDAKEMGSRI